VLHEPVDWAESFQVIIDLLLSTNGHITENGISLVFAFHFFSLLIFHQIFRKCQNFLIFCVGIYFLGYEKSINNQFVDILFANPDLVTPTKFLFPRLTMGIIN
jgi:hypothetical protein